MAEGMGRAVVEVQTLRFVFTTFVPCDVQATVIRGVEVRCAGQRARKPRAVALWREWGPGESPFEVCRWLLRVRTPPLVQVAVNDPKLTGPMPSVAWTRVFLTRYPVVQADRHGVLLNKTINPSTALPNGSKLPNLSNHQRVWGPPKNSTGPWRAVEGRSGVQRV